jgi:hypothetical protein
MTDAQDAWVSRVLGINVGAAPPGDAADQAIDGWLRERAAAVGILTQLERAFRRCAHPYRDHGIMMVRAVRAQLVESLANQQQVNELAVYLQEDDVVAALETPNVFGIEVNLRRPLLTALGALRV